MSDPSSSETRTEPLCDEAATALALGLSPATLIAHRSRRKPLLPFVRIGRAIRHDPADIRAFIAAHKTGAAR